MTTIAFALAAIALLPGRSALLAARLLVAMIGGFQLLVWLPGPFADLHLLINWAGNAENLSIAGAAWIVAECQVRQTSKPKKRLLIRWCLGSRRAGPILGRRAPDQPAYAIQGPA